MSGIPALIFVGGFLGAGKTTLIVNAARRLQARGQRVALILNDQDNELVDTRYVRAENFAAAEVAGGCFCCRFSDLLDRAQQLRAHQPDLIFAEPVGSCIDLSATILRPFQAFHREAFSTAPLTVLLDPLLTQQVFNGDAGPEVTYLFRQQLREADILCLTKADLHPHPPPLPFPVDFQISAQSGLGLDAWLDEVLSGRRTPGAHLLDVDYEEYADAEAALGWLNLHAHLRLDQPASPASLIGPLLEQLDNALTTAGVTIAHLKLFDQTQTAHLMGTIRANGDTPNPQGDLIAESTTEHQLAINLRALGDPSALQLIVENALSQLSGHAEISHLRAFRPPPPVPEHRLG